MKGRTTTNRGRTYDRLPDYIKAHFRNRFLPTYFHLIGASEDPWDASTLSMDKVQAAYDAIYPNDLCDLKPTDNIILVV